MKFLSYIENMLDHLELKVEHGESSAGYPEKEVPESIRAFAQPKANKPNKAEASKADSVNSPDSASAVEDWEPVSAALQMTLRAGCSTWKTSPGSDQSPEARVQQPKPVASVASAEITSEPCCQVADCECNHMNGHDVLAQTVKSPLQEKFDRLVERFRRELQSVQRSYSETSCHPLDLLEVFCGPNSELTQQAKHLGRSASLFGLQGGNLSSIEGRQKLFWTIVMKAQTSLV